MERMDLAIVAAFMVVMAIALLASALITIIRRRPDAVHETMAKVAESTDLIELHFKRELLSQYGIPSYIVRDGKVLIDIAGRDARHASVRYKMHYPAELCVDKAVLKDAQKIVQCVAS